jgi:putative cell wall-binding protein
MGTNQVHLLGGTSSLGPEVVTALQGAGMTVDRIAGNDRYETAGLIAQGGGAIGLDGSGRKTAVVASGTIFPDALAAGPIVFGKHFPQLLTDPAALSGPTASTLTGMGIQHVLLVGGTGAVSSAVESQIAGMGIAVDRISGPTRYDTSVALANLAVEYYGFTPAHIDVATGVNFPDALVGGTHAGGNKAALLLVPTTGGTPSAVCNLLKARGDGITSGHIFGGDSSVDGGVQQGLQECIQNLSAFS